MDTEERVEGVMALLDEHYGPIKCYLVHDNPWQLLIATILSAQCTDDRRCDHERWKDRQYPYG